MNLANTLAICGLIYLALAVVGVESLKCMSNYKRYDPELETHYFDADRYDQIQCPASSTMCIRAGCGGSNMYACADREAFCDWINCYWCHPCWGDLCNREKPVPSKPKPKPTTTSSSTSTTTTTTTTTTKMKTTTTKKPRTKSAKQCPPDCEENGSMKVPHLMRGLPLLILTIGYIGIRKWLMAGTF